MKPFIDWKQSAVVDATRIVEANLSPDFWKTLRSVTGDKLTQGKTATTAEIDGDTLTLGRSYCAVTREGKRLATLPMYTLRLAVKFADAQIAAAADAAKKKKRADSITWEP